MKKTSIWLSAAAVCLLMGCSDDSSPDRDSGPTGDTGTTTDKGAPTEASVNSDGSTTGKYEITVDDDLLDAIEVRFLKGRCLGRVSIKDTSADARIAVVTFAEGVAATIPLDGSVPASDNELKGMIPGDNEMPGWTEDPADTEKGPWLITTTAFDWIDGGGQPFADNGFEAAAGENYVNTANSWALSLELVNQGTPAGAEAAFRGAQWDQGNAP